MAVSITEVAADSTAETKTLHDNIVGSLLVSVK